MKHDLRWMAGNRLPMECPWWFRFYFGSAFEKKVQSIVKAEIAAVCAFLGGQTPMIVTPHRIFLGRFKIHAMAVARPSVQSGARRHGIVGIYGDGGNVESVTYRI
jgi:hypothetical protein